MKALLALDHDECNLLLGRLRTTLKKVLSISVMLWIGGSVRAEAYGVIKEFETGEALRAWATNPLTGGEIREFKHRNQEFAAVSFWHIGGAPKSEVFLFGFRSGRWTALLHLGDPEFEVEMTVRKNRFQVWKKYYSTTEKPPLRRRIYAEIDLNALEFEP